MNRVAYDDIRALNWSKGKLLLRTPYHFQYAYTPDDSSESDALLIGRLTHGLVLEGKSFKDLVAIRPKGMDFRNKEGRAWRDAQTLPILDSADKDRILGMASALAMNEDARKYIERCTLREHVIVTTMSGVKCKGMLDAVGVDNDRRPGFFEIKTSVDAGEDFWAKRCCSAPFHYDGQAEWYASLLSLDSNWDSQEDGRPWNAWIVVENKPPYAVACWAPDESMMASGVEKMRDVLTTFKACSASGIWPGYHTGIKLISAPTWRRNQLSRI